MDKKELAKQICEMEKTIETARNKRNITTIIIFALVFFLISYLYIKPAELFDIFTTAVVSLIAATVHFLINAAVFGSLDEKSESERKMIKKMKEQLDNTTL